MLTYLPIHCFTCLCSGIPAYKINTSCIFSQCPLDTFDIFFNKLVYILRFVIEVYSIHNSQFVYLNTTSNDNIIKSAKAFLMKYGYIEDKGDSFSKSVDFMSLFS